MQRPAAVADLQFVGSGNRGGDVFLRFPAGGDDVAALRQPGGDRRRQRAPGAVRVLGPNSSRAQPHDLALPDQKIGAVLAVAVAAFDQHMAGAEAEDFARLHEEVKEEARKQDRASKKADFEDSKKAVKKVKDSQEKTTLGDISALSDLKDKMDGKK